MDTQKIDAAIGAALLDAGAGYSFERREAGPRAIAYIITYDNQEIGRVMVEGTQIGFKSFHVRDNQELDSRFREIARHINERIERVQWREDALSSLQGEQQAQATGPAEQAGNAKSKRGPHRYSRKEKIEAVNDWDNLDKDLSPCTLAEWLEHRFGAPGGGLNVAESTFHGWRKLLKKP